MNKHGDVTIIDQNLESIYIDYCKLDIDGCKEVYKYLVEQMKRRKENTKKENEEMKKIDIESFINDVRRNGDNCDLMVGDKRVPVSIDNIHYGRGDELLTFEGTIYEYSYEHKRKNQSKVSYRDFYDVCRSATPTNTSTLPKIKDVIFNPPATIILWEDNTKTVVKCQEDYEFDPWTGLTTAIVKKALGNKGNYCNVLNKWVDKYETNERIKLSDIIESVAKTQAFSLTGFIKNLSGENSNDEG